MIKLTKKIEYAILAVQYIALNEGRLASAKEISEKLNISFEFLSKTMQKLIHSGIVVSQQGAKGGYSLARRAEETTIEDIIKAIDENTALVECFESHDSENCGRSDSCTLRSPIGRIQYEINSILRNTTVADITRSELAILSDDAKSFIPKADIPKSNISKTKNTKQEKIIQKVD
jgi:Rrf2 family protein